jgi:hypothetical protein
MMLSGLLMEKNCDWGKFAVDLDMLNIMPGMYNEYK